jgi:predicted cytidylate kinase
MIISFTGSEGSGKSGIAKRLAATLGWPYYDIGGLRRAMATKKGLTLEEYNKLGETDSSTDLEVDNYQAKLGKESDNFIIVGRTSWHFIPHSLKIFLSTRIEVGAERIFNNMADRREAKNIKTIEDLIQVLRRRVESDIFRYKKYFSIDVFNKDNYDLLLDTSDLTEEEAYQAVEKFVKEKLESAAVSSL